VYRGWQLLWGDTDCPVRNPFIGTIFNAISIPIAELHSINCPTLGITEVDISDTLTASDSHKIIRRTSRLCPTGFRYLLNTVCPGREVHEPIGPSGISGSCIRVST